MIPAREHDSNVNDEQEQAIIEHDIFTNRRYQIALTAAILLFLAMLTLTILAVILVSGREEDREAEFESTLTAIFQAAPLAEITAVVGDYPVMLAAGSPSYTTAPSCDQPTLTGTIRDRDGAPTDAFSVAIWGDLVPYQVLQTGSAAGQDSGQWALTLDSAADRYVYVQILSDDRYRSAPVTINLYAADCVHNAVTVDFTQIAPLD